MIRLEVDQAKARVLGLSSQDVAAFLNTSLNGPGEPIVESPADALRLFTSSGMDSLALLADGAGWLVRRASGAGV